MAEGAVEGRLSVSATYPYPHLFSMGLDCFDVIFAQVAIYLKVKYFGDLFEIVLFGEVWISVGFAVFDW